MDKKTVKFFTPQEVADKLRISKQTLGRYERKSIFPKPRRNTINKWRVYTEKDLQKLQRILRVE